MYVRTSVAECVSDVLVHLGESTKFCQKLLSDWTKDQKESCGVSKKKFGLGQGLTTPYNTIHGPIPNRMTPAECFETAALPSTRSDVCDARVCDHRCTVTLEPLWRQISTLTQSVHHKHVNQIWGTRNSILVSTQHRVRGRPYVRVAAGTRLVYCIWFYYSWPLWNSRVSW